MSVRTTADDKRDEALEHLSNAYQNLLQALDLNTCGAADFSDEYIDTMHEMCLKILEIKRRLS